MVYGGEGEERHICLKTRLRTFLLVKFFCMIVLLHSVLNKREDHFLRVFSKILRGEWRGRLKTFLFYNKVESHFMLDIVLFVIDFFVIFSSKQK